MAATSASHRHSCGRKESELRGRWPRTTDAMISSTRWEVTNDGVKTSTDPNRADATASDSMLATTKSIDRAFVARANLAFWYHAARCARESWRSGFRTAVVLAPELAGASRAGSSWRR